MLNLYSKLKDVIRLYVLGFIIAIDVHKFVKAEQSYGLLVSISHENIMIILGYLLSSQRFWLHEPFSRLKHYKNVRVFVDYIGISHGIN